MPPSAACAVVVLVVLRSGLAALDDLFVAFVGSDEMGRGEEEE
ncbi:MAG: hypothetical protein AAF411_06645 [Myxococcota bacterium]